MLAKIPECHGCGSDGNISVQPHAKVKTMSTSLVGGWSAFNFELSSAAREVFQEAVRHLLGVSYTPFAFATQVVAGTNYSYLAQAKTVAPESSLRVVRVHIFQPLPGKGEPHVTQIIAIEP